MGHWQILEWEEEEDLIWQMAKGFECVPCPGLERKHWKQMNGQRI